MSFGKDGFKNIFEWLSEVGTLQKYLKSRDSQLAKMSDAVESAMEKVQTVEAAAAQRARAADTAVIEAAASAADKVSAEAADAMAIARARVDLAQKAALATQESARQAQAAQLETAEVAQRLFSEAAAAADLAAAAHSECAALQEEVASLRKEVAEAGQQRDAALRIAAEKQAVAVRHVRTSHEMCEHRVQEAQNSFEALKLAERDGARRARDDTDQATMCAMFTSCRTTPVHAQEARTGSCLFFVVI